MIGRVTPQPVRFVEARSTIICSNMPSHDREIPLLKRAAILTLYWYGEKNWAEISALLKVNPEKAKAICARAKVSESFPAIGV